ncbi:MAG: DNRLRE domain-containing protein [Lentisphaerota bacterium]
MGYKNNERSTYGIGIVHDRGKWIETWKPYNQSGTGKDSQGNITSYSQKTGERITVAGGVPAVRDYSSYRQVQTRREVAYDAEGWVYYCHDYRVLVMSQRDTRSNQTGSDPKHILEDYIAFAKTYLKQEDPLPVNLPPGQIADVVTDSKPIYPHTPVVTKYVGGVEYFVPSPLLGPEAGGVIMMTLGGHDGTILNEGTGKLLRQGDFVFDGDILSVNKCMVKLALLSSEKKDGFVQIVLKPDTRVQFLPSRPKREGIVDFVLHFGKLLFSGNEKYDRHGYRIITSNAHTGCEGTEFETAYDPVTGKTTVSVFEGVVSIACRTANTPPQIVKAGFSAIMDKDCRHTITTTDPAVNTANTAGWVFNEESGTAITPRADSHVYAYAYSDWSKANWGKYDRLGAGWHPSGGEKRAYLAFDLSGVSAARVGKATLRLFHYHTGGGNALALGVYRVTSSWTEGTGTYKPSTPAKPGEISWVNQPSFDPRPVAQFHPGPGVDKWVEVDVTPLVRAWLSGTPNHGLMIKAEGALTRNTPHAEYGFYSREAAAEKRPVLVLSDGLNAPPVQDASRNFDQALALPCAPDKDFVRSLYHCITHREPTAEALAAQVEHLRSGITRQLMVTYFFASPGYVNQNHDGIRFMTDACQAIYGRQPTAAANGSQDDHRRDVQEPGPLDGDAGLRGQVAPTLHRQSG